MAKGWKCPRCGVMNDDAALNCSNCRLIRGAVVPPGTTVISPAPRAEAAVLPGGGTMAATIERGLRAYLADPETLEFVTFSVVGAENLYVQFVVADGALVGESVSEDFLSPEERRRVDGRALERLGFQRLPGGNYTRTWALPPDIADVAAIAADALGTYGIPADAGLHIVHATGGATAGSGTPWAGATRPGTAPARPTPLWRRIPLQLVVVGLLVVGGAVAGWYFNASRGSSGEITRSGDLSVAELRVGDCFDLKDPNAEEVGDVAARVCSEEHEFEMFFVGALADGGFPADDVFEAFVDDACIPAFEAYVGTPYLDSELDLFYFVPSSDGWGDGDRSVQCALYHPTISRLTGSLKGSGR